MSDRNIPEFIQSILAKHNGFMKVKDIIKPVKDFIQSMSLDDKRKLGLTVKNITNKKLQQILEGQFIFTKNGSTQYILVPCEPSELVINALSAKQAVSPKVIAKTLPFSAKDFIEILNELSESWRIRIILNDKFEARIILSDSHEGHEENNIQSSGEYTRERFRAAFDELEHGRVFVNIPELRKKLAWPHDVFDDMIRKLRDEEVIVLHVTDRTRFEPEEFFYDEHDNARIGMVTWNEGQQIDS